ncbi:MAG: STAS domain-containing protein [Alphaproteobacteria bacterium]|nr:STAS domain-containing protein [Alphaproteobacteria bacterium]
MEIEMSDHGGVLVVAPQGRLDSNSAPEFEAVLLGRIESGDRKLVIDFSGIHYVSSAGLRVLLMAAKRTIAVGGSFAIHSMSDTIHEVFDISGFLSIFAVYNSLDEALRQVG